MGFEIFEHEVQAGRGVDIYRERISPIDPLYMGDGIARGGGVGVLIYSWCGVVWCYVCLVGWLMDAVLKMYIVYSFTYSSAASFVASCSASLILPSWFPGRGILLAWRMQGVVDRMMLCLDFLWVVCGAGSWDTCLLLGVDDRDFISRALYL